MARKVDELAREHWWGFAAMPEEQEYPVNKDGDPMTLIFLIKPEDRAAKRFDNVVCALYSY